MFQKSRHCLPSGKIIVFTAWLILLRTADISADSCRRQVEQILDGWMKAEAHKWEDKKPKFDELTEVMR